MPDLLTYLNLLSKDSNVQAAHNNDPHAAMTNFGLSQDEQAALLSGNRAVVAQLIGIQDNVYNAIDSIEYDPFPPGPIQ